MAQLFDAIGDQLETIRMRSGFDGALYQATVPLSVRVAYIRTAGTPLEKIAAAGQTLGLRLRPTAPPPPPAAHDSYIRLESSTEKALKNMYSGL